MILPEVLGKDLVYQVVRIIFVHLDLFENDAALANDVFVCKDRVKNEVG